MKVIDQQKFDVKGWTRVSRLLRSRRTLSLPLKFIFKRPCARQTRLWFQGPAPVKYAEQLAESPCEFSLGQLSQCGNHLVVVAKRGNEGVVALRQTQHKPCGCSWHARLKHAPQTPAVEQASEFIRWRHWTPYYRGSALRTSAWACGVLRLKLLHMSDVRSFYATGTSTSPCRKWRCSPRALGKRL